VPAEVLRMNARREAVVAGWFLTRPKVFWLELVSAQFESLWTSYQLWGQDSNSPGECPAPYREPRLLDLHGT
jgi:hypothetical protein